MTHLLLFYLFLSFSAGIFILGTAVFLLRRTGERLFLHYLFFYGSFSLLVASHLLLSYADVNLDQEGSTLYFSFRYMESFVSRYLVMLTLPLFTFNLFNLSQRSRRNSITASITLITFLLQHLTEFAAGDDRIDQAGDYFEDAVFIALVCYCFIAGWRAGGGCPRGFVKSLLPASCG